EPDIVHNHLGWGFILFEDSIECPIYHTIHGPITAAYERYTYEQHPHANYISISNNQRKPVPDINWVKTIYNGIDVDAFELGPPKSEREYFVFLGRASHE